MNILLKLSVQGASMAIQTACHAHAVWLEHSMENVNW